MSRLVIGTTWAGAPLAAAATTRLAIDVAPEGLRLTLDAPFHGDPPPPEDGQPRGARDGLWEFEVVELFLAGPEGAYLELEFGPHGHALALQFSSYRQRLACFELPSRARIEDHRWTAEATVPSERLPRGPWRGNAFAMHGLPPGPSSGSAPGSSGRVHLAAFPAGPGRAPDFHDPNTWRALRADGA